MELSPVICVVSITGGLYRDDGLAISNLTARETENTKKAICEAFKQYNLSITIEANLKVVNFLDVQLDLENGLYKPYIKPNEKPNYVHSQSNHPPGTIKNIPVSINKRLSNISANKEIFDQAATIYQAELDTKGYQYKLNYQPSIQEHRGRRNRTRNITWYNPPYSRNVKTNVGAKFLSIISRNFPKNHPLHKIINKNTIKLKYRCMPNLKSHIDRHNKRVLNGDQNNNPTEAGCNCLKSRRNDCPLPGRNSPKNNIRNSLLHTKVYVVP